jgi:hypothetical protein
VTTVRGVGHRTGRRRGCVGGWPARRSDPGRSIEGLTRIPRPRAATDWDQAPPTSWCASNDCRRIPRGAASSCPVQHDHGGKHRPRAPPRQERAAAGASCSNSAGMTAGAEPAECSDGDPLDPLGYACDPCCLSTPCSEMEARERKTMLSGSRLKEIRRWSKSAQHQTQSSPHAPKSQALAKQREGSSSRHDTVTVWGNSKNSPSMTELLPS